MAAALSGRAMRLRPTAWPSTREAQHGTPALARGAALSDSRAGPAGAPRPCIAAGGPRLRRSSGTPRGLAGLVLPGARLPLRGGPPHGVGTIRLMSLRGGIRARERLIAWDENRRFAYRVEEDQHAGHP